LPESDDYAKRQLLQCTFGSFQQFSFWSLGVRRAGVAASDLACHTICIRVMNKAELTGSVLALSGLPLGLAHHR
jgi:hypothetical protein